MNYLVLPENERYFYKNGRIIKRGMFAEESILCEAKSPFCVKKSNGKTHIIGLDSTNALVYVNDRKHIICKLNDKLNVKRIRMAGRFMGFLCSAEYNGENLLIHCVLGNNAKPSVIGRMTGEYFFDNNDRVYYTNDKGFLGYSEIGDGKPEGFIPVAEGAVFPYVSEDDLIYIKSGKIYLNHLPEFDASDAETPVLCKWRDVRIIAWRSGGILKYASVEDNNVKHILSTEKPELFCVCDGEREYYSYTHFLN